MNIFEREKKKRIKIWAVFLSRSFVFGRFAQNEGNLFLSPIIKAFAKPFFHSTTKEEAFFLSFDWVLLYWRSVRFRCKSQVLSSAKLVWSSTPFEINFLRARMCAKGVVMRGWFCSVTFSRHICMQTHYARAGLQSHPLLFFFSPRGRLTGVKLNKILFSCGCIGFWEGKKERERQKNFAMLALVRFAIGTREEKFCKGCEELGESWNVETFCRENYEPEAKCCKSRLLHHDIGLQFCWKANERVCSRSRGRIRTCISVDNNPGGMTISGIILCLSGITNMKIETKFRYFFTFFLIFPSFNKFLPKIKIHNISSNKSENCS